jgi:hydrogenase maturation protease
VDHDLVIGYGNELRGDDGAGPRVAASVAACAWDGVRAIACHELTPELADAVASARRVVFVDAAVGPGESVRLQRIGPADAVPFRAHSGDPASLLALARAVFHRCPPAWLLTIPAVAFDFGGEFSAPTRRGLGTALARIRSVLGRDGAVEAGVREAGYKAL